MGAFRFVCIECGRAYQEEPARYVCHACAGLQQPGGPVRGTLSVELETLPDRFPHASLRDSRALAPFLPVNAGGLLDRYPVGGTPLLEAPRLRAALGMPRLWVKDDTRNPSGSTKDRASWLVVTKALEYGLDTVATASTGNAATALAAVAAAAGVRAVVLVPAAAPPAKLVQMAAYGAAVVAVQGTYDDAFELSLAACESFGWYNRNTAYNPFTIEGKKTAALEIGAALRDEPPDVVVVPTGDGVIAAGVAKGFSDLVRAGLLPRVPRLLLVQPEGSPALARAIREGTAEIRAVPGAESVADSLVVAAPRNAVGCLQAVRSCGGSAVTVPDEAILAAIPRLASLTGVFAEPAAAAALAGLERALAEGLVGSEERTVLLVTGTGLKDVGAAARSLPAPRSIPPTLDALAGALATA